MMKKEKLQASDDSMLYCNVCGRKLKMEDGILKEDVFGATKDWGFFSKKDLEVHKFNMCEECYDEMINKFVIPVKKLNKNEVLS